ncbi:hypothetical protein [Azospirillum thermophilum]|uniref:Uncharacterized protein n=1 Tax=Azospirillum thermophilum TaxID=2202148 RepID=A0A2S2CWE1_9PROT|nr:hypothetical protein [Azospirillum thermophilum]AWK88844.1 hypothetical protein DEW08_22515 [Azospirillum thermophilum]
MNDLPHRQTWRCRVAELLQDPIAQALLRRDRLTDAAVLAQLSPIADHLRGAGSLRASAPQHHPD